MTTPSTDIRTLITARETDLAGILEGSGITPDKFKATLFQLWERDYNLRSCTPESLITGIMAIADVGLTFAPSLGHAYLVKYKNSAVPIVGWRGLVHLALRSGGALDIRAGVRREGDQWIYQPLSPTEPIVHIPSDSPGKPVGYYAVAFLPHGIVRAEYMTREAVLAHGKKFSRAFENTHKSDGSIVEVPWQKNTEEMCLKTLVRKVCKYLRLTGNLEKAMTLETTATEIDAMIEEHPDVLVSEMAEGGGIADATGSTRGIASAEEASRSKSPNAGASPAPPTTDRALNEQEQIRVLAAMKHDKVKLAQLQPLFALLSVDDWADVRLSQLGQLWEALPPGMTHLSKELEALQG